MNREIKYSVLGAKANFDTDNATSHSREILRVKKYIYTIKHRSGITSNLNPIPKFHYCFQLLSWKRQMWSVNAEPKASTLLKISSDQAISTSWNRIEKEEKEEMDSFYFIEAYINPSRAIYWAPTKYKVLAHWYLKVQCFIRMPVEFIMDWWNIIHNLLFQ